MKAARSRILNVFAVAVGSAAVAGADATVERKMRVEFGGAMGGLINRFGNKMAKAGLVGTMTVKGDRRLMLSGDKGEIVDLGEEKVYRLDLASKTYTVETFEALRQRTRDRTPTSSVEKATEFEVDLNVKETGQKQAINGYDTRQVLATLTVRRKGRKVEEGGGVLTADMWLGPHLPPVEELEDFNRRYYEKLYGGLPGGEMAQAAAMLSTTPAFREAMKKLQETKAKLDGTPVRTILSFEMVGLSPAEVAAAPDGAGPSAGGAPLGPGLFSATNEIVKASAAARDVAIPAGFRQK